MTTIRLALVATLTLLLSPFSQAADPDRYVPADATIVVHISTRQMLDSPLGKQYGPKLLQAVLQHNGQVQKLLEGLGVDPLKDIDSLILASPGASAEAAVVVAHGRINRDGFHKAAEDLSRQNSAAIKIHRDGLFTIYEGKQADGSAFATFPAPDTLLLSPSRAALTAAARGNARLSKEMAAVVAGVDGQQSLWVAALIPEELKTTLAKQPQTAELASKVQAVTATLNVDRDVNLGINLLTSEAQAAGTLAELLEGMKGFGKLYAASVPQFGTLLTQVVDSVKVTTNQNGVGVALNVSERMIEQGIQAARAQHAPAPSAVPAPPVKKTPIKKR